jgi:transposase
MPRTCSICNHNRRADIEAAILAGDSYRSIAKRFGAGDSAILRHKNDGHVAQKLFQAREASAQAESDGLFERLRELNRETAATLRAAKEAKNLHLVLMAIARAEKQIELEGKLLGELGDGAKDGGLTLNLHVTEYRMPESASPANHRAIPAHVTPVPLELDRVAGIDIPRGLQRYEIDPELIGGSNGR